MKKIKQTIHVQFSKAKTVYRYPPKQKTKAIPKDTKAISPFVHLEKRQGANGEQGNKASAEP
jgi:hypothetical protein